MKNSKMLRTNNDKNNSKLYEELKQKMTIANAAFIILMIAFCIINFIPYCMHYTGFIAIVCMITEVLIVFAAFLILKFSELVSDILDDCNNN